MLHLSDTASKSVVSPFVMSIYCSML